MAPQLIGTNGLSRRGLRLWIARAMSSLPVPLSPVMRIETSVAATRFTVSKTSSIDFDIATMPSNSCRAPSFLLSASSSVSREKRYAARFRIVRSSSIGVVFEQKS